MQIKIKQAILVVMGLLLFLIISLDGAVDTQAIQRAFFHPDGSIQLPRGYRQWAHVGTRYKSSGLNLLDGLTLQDPQVMNVYVEPSAMTYYERTGVWPDGAQIVKEFSEIRTGKDCDPATYICSSDLGKGIFEVGFSGLAMMVKDKRHFPNEAGNWAYFGFGHQSPPYKVSALPFPREQCASCHIKNASKSGYVFVRAHIGLAANAVP